MDDTQFNDLIKELLNLKTGIIDKLDEIRCGIIDVESEIQNIKKELKEAK